jgi:hypothetical protein
VAGRNDDPTAFRSGTSRALSSSRPQG